MSFLVFSRRVLLLGVWRDLYRDAVVVLGEAGFGKLQFQFGEDFHRGRNRFRILADAASHFEKNAANFSLFLIEQANEFVVLLDSFQRLDKNRLPAGTCAVNHALHAALLLDLHGNHEALAADGNQLILNCATVGQPAQIALQRFLNSAPLLFDFATNAREIRRRAIFEGSVGVNFVAEKSQKIGEIEYARSQSANAVPLRSHAGWGVKCYLAPFLGAIHDANDAKNLFGFEHRAFDARFFNLLPDI